VRVSRKLRIAFIAAPLALAALTSRDAHAQNQSAVAETLFREGKSLMDAGKLSEACPKLAESERLDPASGTMLALAFCYEKSGKTASAWSSYNEAASLARRDGVKEREQAAVARAKSLEAKLVKLRVVVSDEARSIAGLEVTISGLVLAPAAWGSALPVDPGDVVVVAHAPGRTTIEKRLSVHEGDVPHDVVIETPPLEPKKEEPIAPPPVAPQPQHPPPPPNEASSKSWGTGKYAGIAIGGAGLVAVGVGAYFGFTAKSENDDANNACPSGRSCSSFALGKKSDAETHADVASVLVGAGAAVAVAGAVIFVLSGRDAKSEPSQRGQQARQTIQPRVTPIFLPGGGGVGMSGAF
jgi:hypothetical protein